MSTSPKVAGRLHGRVCRYNRELKLDALLKVLLGVVFTFLVFGLLYWFGWFVGFFIARSLNLEAWQFGALLSGLFLVVATWSAWRHVDPLAGVQRLTDQQLLLHLVSRAAGILYFSPRHASAGAAVVFIGGPASVLQGLGIWASRLRTDPALLEQAALLAAACNANYPVEEVKNTAAALLLRRLALIKVIPSGDSFALTLTESGHSVVSGPKKRGRMRSTAPGVTSEDSSA